MCDVTAFVTRDVTMGLTRDGWASLVANGYRACAYRSRSMTVRKAYGCREQTGFLRQVLRQLFPRNGEFSTIFVRFCSSVRVSGKSRKAYIPKGFKLAGELGFEPRQTESESVVLPLHHSPPKCLIYKHYFQRFSNIS